MPQPTLAPPLKAAAERVLIAELDSPAQREHFDRLGPRQAIIELTGMLRIGMLVSHTVLVTDAMLLDGTYFMTLGPDRVLRELGASESRYPLVITGRAASLRESLNEKLASKTFTWSLPQMQGVVEPSDALRETWRQWVEYVENGTIYYLQQTSKPTFVLGEPSFRSGVPESLIKQLREQPVRSDAWDLIRAEVTPSDQPKILDWWNSGYLQMLARNTNADWVTFESGASLSSEQDRGTIRLSQRLVEWARNSNSATVALAWDATAKQRRRLHAKPTWARMKDLAYTATRVGTAPTRRNVIVESVLKAVLALAALVMVFDEHKIISFEHDFTWIAILLAIATTVPYAALLTLLGLLKRDAHTALILHRTERHFG